jgi:hypothetical protein
MDELERQKIAILLNEYSTLRAEIVVRIGHLYQLIGFGTGAIILLNTVGVFLEHAFWYLVTLVVVTFAISLWFYGRYAWLLSERVREIELDVNDRVREDLLVWENLWGGRAIGFFGFKRHLPPSHLADQERLQRTWRGAPLKS